MIIFIEGPRHTGKTHLMEEFFKQNQNPNVLYYKFAFAKYIEELGMRDQETGPGVHYFSIANVLTILELNKEILKDKVIVFDRSIFSAYVWSIYRERMDKQRLLNEFEKVLDSDLYQNCALVYLTRKEIETPEKRDKDYFGNFENYDAEKKVFEEVLEMASQYTSDSSKRNFNIMYLNNFDTKSVALFCQMLNDIANLG
jgi:thymidylate kinase